MTGNGLIKEMIEEDILEENTFSMYFDKNDLISDNNSDDS